MFYEQKMVNEIDTAKFADVGCIWKKSSFLTVDEPF